MIDLSKVDPEKLALAQRLLKQGVTVPPDVLAQQRMIGMPIGEFSANHWHLDDGSTLTLRPHQLSILNFAFNPLNCPPFGFQTVLYSTVKKSGKTECAGLICRWAAETWGGGNQVYCCAYQTPVLMADGSSKKIWEIVRDRLPGPVASLNEEGQLVPKLVTGWYRSKLQGRSYVNIKDSSDVYGRSQGLWVTQDHPILTPEGYVPADSLQTGDPIVTGRRQPNSKQIALIIGTLLGDAYLNTSPGPYHESVGNSALVLLQSAKQEEWLKLKVDALQGLGPTQLRYNAARDQFSWASYANPWFTLLRQQFYDKKKIKQVPRDLVEQYFSSELLAAWYLDDGNFGSNRLGTPNFAVDCFTHDDVVWLVELLKKHGLEATVTPTSNFLQYRIYIKAISRTQFMQMIGRFIRPSMRYKLNDSASEYDPTSWQLGNSTPYIAPCIISTENPPQRQSVFCLDVEETHNFVAANTIIHNCVANDKEQSRGRIYGAIQRSIEKDPFYDKAHKILKSKDGIDRWRIIERDLLHLPTSSIIRAIAGDHEGEAGSNPTITAFTEIWALRLERDKRLWTELTPVNTRERSMRIVETYAGYIGESNILWDLWRQSVKEGKHLTIQDVPDWPFEPDDEEGHVPFYVNYDAQLFAYIDQGPKARRMPWQQGERGDIYYSTQAYALRDQIGQFDRLHNNYWVERATAFIPIQSFINNYDESLAPSIGEYGPGGFAEYVAQQRIPCIIGADGAVSGDCTAIVMVCRHPKYHSHTVPVYAKKWDPPPGGQMDYEHTIKADIQRLFMKYNILEVCYDPTQLHHLMYEMRRTDRRRSDPDYFPTINTREFGQGTERRKSDKRLFDVIVGQQTHHDGLMGGGYADMIEHLQNSGAEYPNKEDRNLKIVKLDTGKIDLVIAWSMANHRCMEYIL